TDSFGTQKSVHLPTLRRHPRGCLRTARGRCVLKAAPCSFAEAWFKVPDNRRTARGGGETMNRTGGRCIVAVIALVAGIATASAQPAGGTKIGTLNCQLAPSIGFIIGSHDPMRCRYTPDGPFPPEFYDGVISTIGLDIGFTTGGV